jgi:hypothetical protein
MGNIVGTLRKKDFDSTNHLWIAKLGLSWRNCKFIRFVDCTLDGNKLEEKQKYRIPRRRKTILVGSGITRTLFFVPNNWDIPTHDGDKGQTLIFVNP